MNTKTKAFLGIISVFFVTYKILNFKIGPCSPELEVLIND